VREAIESHIPYPEWERLLGIEMAERNQWREVMGQFKGGAA
jgi:hypothetical protein